jgi:hypothetical protein
MKRDMEIIRAILLKVEEKCPPNEYEIFTEADFPDLDWNVVWAHFRLMEQKEFFQGVSQEIGTSRFSVDGLSWEGYEFLETVRNSEIWKKTKSTAVDLKNFGYETIKMIAKGYLKKKLKDMTELDLS